MRIAYDGTQTQGWQRQPGNRTVQELLEQALRSSGLEGHLQGASRTDAGVHAMGQVAHIDASVNPEDLPALRLEISKHLPDDIRLINLVRAPPRFNARWASRGKIYTYLISEPQDLTLASQDGFLLERTWTLPDPRGFPEIAAAPKLLDISAMSSGLKSLLGTRNFAGIATTRDPRASKKKTTRRLGAGIVIGAPYPGSAGGRLISITVSGDAFLKHMIRNLCGLLCQVGYGEEDAKQLPELVMSRRRHQGPRAPGRGLTLVRVRYPAPVAPLWGS